MKTKEDDKLLEPSYWAGRLLGHDQAWEVAQEIVNEIQEWRTVFNTEVLLNESLRKENEELRERLKNYEP